MKMTTLSELKTELMQDSSFKQDYETLAEEFELIQALIDMRKKSGLTQEQIAEKMGTKKSNISRLEGGNGNPGWKTLQNYAQACGFKIKLQYS